MRQILLLALALLCAPVQAQFSCLPDTLLTPPPLSVGSPTADVETPAAEGSGWWCPVFAGGMLSTYRMNIRWVLKGHKTNYSWRGTFARVKEAPNLLAAVNAEMAANSVAVVPGSQDAYEVDLIKYKVCQALITPPYLIPVPSISPTFCGAAPVPPAPTAAVWRTPSSAGLKVYNRAAGDKLGSAIAGRTAPSNAACNHNAPRVALGTSVYFPLNGGPLNELVLCRLVQ